MSFPTQIYLVDSAHQVWALTVSTSGVTQVSPSPGSAVETFWYLTDQLLPAGYAWLLGVTTGGVTTFTSTQIPHVLTSPAIRLYDASGSLWFLTVISGISQVGSTMPTYSSDVLPTSTGIKLGSATLVWDAFIQNLAVTSNSKFSETTAPSAAANFDLLWGDSTAHRLKMSNNNGAADTVVGAATTDTFTNKTFDSAGAGNVFKINGTSFSSVTGTGAVVLANSPTIVTPTIAQIVNSGTLSLPSSTDTLVGRNTTDTLTNKTLASPTITGATLTTSTLTSPVVNGTPTGTGIPTVTLKTGTGVGNYTTASTSYVRADTTNLVYAVTIPTGWKLLVAASGSLSQSTGVVGVNIALADGTADNTGILVETASIPGTTSTPVPWALNWVVNGDGALHTINLQFKTLNGADAAAISNSSSTTKPAMTFALTPSN